MLFSVFEVMSSKITFYLECLFITIMKFKINSQFRVTVATAILPGHAIMREGVILQIYCILYIATVII